MFSLIFYVLILSLNVLIILLGLYVYNDPDNEWIRMFNGIPDHVEQDDVELSQIKFRAVIALWALRSWDYSPYCNLSFICWDSPNLDDPAYPVGPY